MDSGIKPIVNFYIYSSIHISIAAALFTLESYCLLGISINYIYIVFVFFSTMLTYSIHRLIGIRKLDNEFIEGRFKVIKNYKSHIFVYSIISFLATTFLLLKLPPSLLFLLILPAIISALYTIPLLAKKRRLRDYNYIKIILIALTWACVANIDLWSNAISNYNLKELSSISVWIWIALLLEKALYIFAITLPFDIRDDIIDKHLNVKTFPWLWGHSRTYTVINILLFVCSALTITLFNVLKISHPLSFFAIFLAFGASYWAVKKSRGKQSDLYYSGMLDGIIILRSLLIIGGIYFSVNG